MGLKTSITFEKIIKIISLIIILALIAYCVYFKIQFFYIIFLVILFILLPYASNITEFSFAQLLKVKIEKEIEKILPYYAKVYKEVFQREFVSSLKNHSIELKYNPDPETIKLTFGHETRIPYEDKENFRVVGNLVEIKDKVILRNLKFYIDQPPGNYPIVEYLRKI